MHGSLSCPSNLRDMTRSQLWRQPNCCRCLQSGLAVLTKIASQPPFAVLASCAAVSSLPVSTATQLAILERHEMRTTNAYQAGLPRHLSMRTCARLSHEPFCVYLCT